MTDHKAFFNDKKANMTPKQKANELFNKFYMILFDSDSDKGEEWFPCCKVCYSVLMKSYGHVLAIFQTPNKRIRILNEA